MLPRPRNVAFAALVVAMWLLTSLACQRESAQAIEITGAGEGIRTLDPNLGNVSRRFTPPHLCLPQNQLRHYWIRSFLAGRHPRPILLLPSDFRSDASPLLPRPPPANPGKQNWEQAWNTRAGMDHG